MQALLLAVKQGEALAARGRELDESLAEQKAQLARIQSQGLGIDPPYPITLLDQLRTEQGLTEYSSQMVDQRRARAQLQVDLRERELAAAMRERRAIRDDLTAAEDSEAKRVLETTLEVVRINALVAPQR